MKRQNEDSELGSEEEKEDDSGPQGDTCPAMRYITIPASFMDMFNRCSPEDRERLVELMTVYITSLEETGEYQLDDSFGEMVFSEAWAAHFGHEVQYPNVRPVHKSIVAARLLNHDLHAAQIHVLAASRGSGG